jgi:hypothetical protein
MQPPLKRRPGGKRRGDGGAHPAVVTWELAGEVVRGVVRERAEPLGAVGAVELDCGARDDGALQQQRCLQRGQVSRASMQGARWVKAACKASLGIGRHSRWLQPACQHIKSLRQALDGVKLGQCSAIGNMSVQSCC